MTPILIFREKRERNANIGSPEIFCATEITTQFYSFPNASWLELYPTASITCDSGESRGHLAKEKATEVVSINDRINRAESVLLHSYDERREIEINRLEAHRNKMHICLRYTDLSLIVHPRTLNSFARALNSLQLCQPIQMYWSQRFAFAPEPMTMFFKFAKRTFDGVHIGRDSQRILNTPNAGGNSIRSEALSLEVMNRLLPYGATLLRSEMEIAYFPRSGCIVDYLVTSPCLSTNNALAVSVTRALAAPKQHLRAADAHRLLARKRTQLFAAAERIFFTPSHTGETPFVVIGKILHVWVSSGRDAKLIRRCWQKLEERTERPLSSASSSSAASGSEPTSKTKSQSVWLVISVAPRDFWDERHWRDSYLRKKPISASSKSDIQML